MKEFKLKMVLAITTIFFAMIGTSLNVFAAIKTTTPYNTIVHAKYDNVEGKSKPDKGSNTTIYINTKDDVHLLSINGDWVESYIDKKNTCIHAWIYLDDLLYSEKIISPVDLSKGTWYFLTYPGHGAASGEAYQEFAVDINLPNNADTGLPVYAIADGIVSLINPLNGSVRICHKDPVTLRSGTVIASNCFYSWMGHMKNITVSTGDEVKKGDIIGYISNKEAVSEHLHFSIGASYEAYGYPYIPISPAWLAESPLADFSLYCGNEYGAREPQGLYEDGLLNDSKMP